MYEILHEPNLNCIVEMQLEIFFQSPIFIYSSNLIQSSVSDCQQYVLSSFSHVMWHVHLMLLLFFSGDILHFIFRKKSSQESRCDFYKRKNATAWSQNHQMICRLLKCQKSFSTNSFSWSFIVFRSIRMETKLLKN